MVLAVHKVGPNRYRERSRRYFEDLMIGNFYEHQPNRTIPEVDNTWFTLLTMNQHPLHFDAEYAKHSEFGRCVECSPLTVALMAGMHVSDVSRKAVANLGRREIKLNHPLFVGDMLSPESEVLDKRASKSRPQAGIVTVKTRGFNPMGTLVCEADRTILAGKRGSEPQQQVVANLSRRPATRFGLW